MVICRGFAGPDFSYEQTDGCVGIGVVSEQARWIARRWWCSCADQSGVRLRSAHPACVCAGWSNRMRVNSSHATLTPFFGREPTVLVVWGSLPPGLHVASTGIQPAARLVASPRIAGPPRAAARPEGGRIRDLLNLTKFMLWPWWWWCSSAPAFGSSLRAPLGLTYH